MARPKGASRKRRAMAILRERAVHHQKELSRLRRGPFIPLNEATRYHLREIAWAKSELSAERWKLVMQMRFLPRPLKKWIAERLRRKFKNEYWEANALKQNKEST